MGPQFSQMTEARWPSPKHGTGTVAVGANIQDLLVAAISGINLAWNLD